MCWFSDAPETSEFGPFVFIRALLPEADDGPLHQHVPPADHQPRDP